MKDRRCTIFFHNYYGAHQEWMEFFTQLPFPFQLFYNIVSESRYNLGVDPNTLTPRGPVQSIVLRHSPNIGKDIGGKMVLFDAFLRLQYKSDIFIFLHDKKSTHKVDPASWRNKLLRILEPSFIDNAWRDFNNDRTGIVASAATIRDEYDWINNQFVSTNGPQLKELQMQYGMQLRDFRYVAGTMFWCRAQPMVDFFAAHSPLAILKTLEKNNVMDNDHGTQTHAWERMLSWIVTRAGYTIIGR